MRRGETLPKSRYRGAQEGHCVSRDAQAHNATHDRQVLWRTQRSPSAAEASS